MRWRYQFLVIMQFSGVNEKVVKRWKVWLIPGEVLIKVETRMDDVITSFLLDSSHVSRLLPKGGKRLACEYFGNGILYNCEGSITFISWQKPRDGLQELLATIDHDWSKSRFLRIERKEIDNDFICEWYLGFLQVNLFDTRQSKPRLAFILSFE